MMEDALASMVGLDLNQFVVPNNVGFCRLECKNAFESLTAQEKLYAHYLSRACYTGSLVCLVQSSPESPAIFVLLMRLLRHMSPENLTLERILELGVKEGEYDAFMTFCAAFFSNMGNYSSFGGVKIIPGLCEFCRCSLDVIVKYCAQLSLEEDWLLVLWDACKVRMYSLTPRERMLGFAPTGISTFYSLNCTLEDAEVAQKFMISQGISACNTRLFKHIFDDGDTIYEIRMASQETAGGTNEQPIMVAAHGVSEEVAAAAIRAAAPDEPVKTSWSCWDRKKKVAVRPSPVTTSGSANVDSVLGARQMVVSGHTPLVNFQVTRGDYSSLMDLLIQDLKLAKDYASNSTEGKMISRLIKCFATGSIRAHKKASAHWVKNKSPSVESFMGFTECFRDPFGVHAEFGGFVAVMNKERSEVLEKLALDAEEFRELLPWPREYEKEDFRQSEFNALTVVTFAGSGIPPGINIPSYDDVRTQTGCKYVSLSNVLSAECSDPSVTFINEKDVALYNKLKTPSYEVLFALHELFGHDCGKLFERDSSGRLNFDVETVQNLITGESILQWYEPGETWISTFKELATTFEECRADCIALYLSLFPEVLAIFGYNESNFDDIIYVNWLNCVRKGILALEYYHPETNTWGQPQMQANFVILNVLVEAGQGLVLLRNTLTTDKRPDFCILLDRTKITTVGREAVKKLLVHLQVYKATGDYPAGKQFYEKYSTISNSPPYFLKLRPIVLENKQPQRIFVQCNTVERDGQVELVEYEASAVGVVQSFTRRFPCSANYNIDDMLIKLPISDAIHYVI